MFCTKCGFALPEDVKFCHKCGFAVERPKSDEVGAGSVEIIAPPKTPASIPLPERSYYTEPQRKSGNTKVILAALGGFTVLVIVIIVIANIAGGIGGALSGIPFDEMSWSDSYYESNPVTGRSNSNTNSDKDASFEWVENARLEKDNSYTFIEDRNIVGSIRNISNKTFSYVLIEFIIYDSSGNQLGTALDSISNFKSGNVWQFKASGLLDMNKVTRFEFLKITTY